MFITSLQIYLNHDFGVWREPHRYLNFTQELNEGNKIILHSWGRGSILYIGRYRGLLKKQLITLLHMYSYFFV